MWRSTNERLHRDPFFSFSEDSDTKKFTGIVKVKKKNLIQVKLLFKEHKVIEENRVISDKVTFNWIHVIKKRSEFSRNTDEEMITESLQAKIKIFLCHRNRFGEEKKSNNPENIFCGFMQIYLERRKVCSHHLNLNHFKSFPYRHVTIS